jgi:hypothetical protein
MAKAKRENAMNADVRRRVEEIIHGWTALFMPQENVPSATLQNVLINRVADAVAEAVQEREAVARSGTSPFSSIYKAYIAGLKAQGCVLCSTCHAYLFPTHTH